MCSLTIRLDKRLVEYESLRRRIMPFAEASGHLVDEDVFRGIS